MLDLEVLGTPLSERLIETCLLHLHLASTDKFSVLTTICHKLSFCGNFGLGLAYLVFRNMKTYEVPSSTYWLTKLWGISIGLVKTKSDFIVRSVETGLGK